MKKLEYTRSMSANNKVSNLTIREVPLQPLLTGQNCGEDCESDGEDKEDVKELRKALSEDVPVGDDEYHRLFVLLHRLQVKLLVVAVKSLRMKNKVRVK